jgi:hypothetical protein
MNYLRIILIVFLFSNAVLAQKDEDEKLQGPIAVTKVVLDAFHKDYPGVTNAKWEYGEGDYEVVFTINGIGMTVDYDVYGQCEETETEIKINELPQTVHDYLGKNYSSFSITGASKIVTKNYEVTYVAEIGKKGKFWDITFSSEGKFMQEEEAD